MNLSEIAAGTCSSGDWFFPAGNCCKAEYLRRPGRLVLIAVSVKLAELLKNVVYLRHYRQSVTVAKQVKTKKRRLIMDDTAKQKKVNRRDILRLGAAALGAGVLAMAAGAVNKRDGKSAAQTVWQLDPDKCVQCGNCALKCVLSPSAVKCVHAYAMCGYCKLCGGYHQPEVKEVNSAVENQLCPTGAIKRTFIEDPFYEYTIDESLCIGCGKCVKGCAAFGNGSLFLQVRHDRCVNCNECAVAVSCPVGAFRRVPVDEPYLLKG